MRVRVSVSISSGGDKPGARSVSQPMAIVWAAVGQQAIHLASRLP